MLSGAMAGADGGTGGMAWYRLRWVLTDVAAYVAELRRPHEHGADIAASLENPAGYVGRPPARSGATAVRPPPGRAERRGRRQTLVPEGAAAA